MDRTHPRFEVDEDRTRDVVLVVGLIEEDVLAIAALGRPLFEDTLFADPVLCTQALPKHRAHYSVPRVSHYAAH